MDKEQEGCGSRQAARYRAATQVRNVQKAVAKNIRPTKLKLKSPNSPHTYSVQLRNVEAENDIKNWIML
jgi:hypothetical protein